MTRIFIAALGLLAFTACGGKSGTLTLKIVVSPGDDPFVDAAQVRFTVGDSAHVTTVPVSMGRFTFKVSGQPQNKSAQIFVDALDAAGNVVAHGQTPQLLLNAVDQGPYAVWVGRPGRVASAPAALTVPVTMSDGTTVNQPLPRAEMASTAIPGLGVLFAGGRDSNGAPLVNTAVYDIYTHDVIPTANLPKALAGAVAAPVSGVHAVVFGGATMGGFGMPGTPEAALNLFDPTVGIGVWAPLPADAIGARAFANGTILSSGAFLISGGIDGGGTPLGTAGLVNPDGTIKLTQLASPMAAARVFHAVAPAKFSDGGDGAILFGGLPIGATGAPVAERLVGQAFSAYDVGAQENRLNATATKMPSGDVLVLGGKTAAGAQASGLVITPNAPAATVTALTTALSVAREGHSATLTGTDLVVCGGADGTGALQASCDVFDATSYARKSTVPMATARRGHSAQLLETGLVVIAGGFGSDGKPLASIEIYTP
jgi:hypothetical protein